MKKSLIVRCFLSLVATVLLLFLCGQVINSSGETHYLHKSNGIGNTSVVGEITRGVCVEQEIMGTDDFHGVRVLLATYENKHLDAEYKIQLIGPFDEILYSQSLEAAELKDNSFYYIPIDEGKNLSGIKVRLRVTSEDATAGNAITIWKSSEDRYSEGRLYVNDEVVDGDIVFDYITDVIYDSNNELVVYRIATLILLLIFVMLNIWIPLDKLYNFIFKYRLAIAIIAFLILVGNKIHYSSIDMFDVYIQEGLESGYDEPIWGKARAIRSDEWLVSTPKRLTTKFIGTGETNNIPMALEMGNLTASGLQFGWGVLAEPHEWGYYTGDVEIGLSFFWNFVFIFAFFFSFELCIILTKGKRLLSLVGAVLIGCSPFFFWWSGTVWLLAGEGAIVCFYYAVNAEKKWLKAFFGIWTAIFGACFVVQLYPAWQVPAGYVFLILLVMMIIGTWEKIKKFDRWEWTIIVLSIVFMASIIVAYLITNSEYVTSISNTVYPGKRVGLGGDMLYNLSNYIGCWFFSIKEVVNPCESSVFFNLFPLPIILGIYYMFKEKKWDGLIGSWTILSVLFTIYCSIEIPEWLAKLTLMSTSTAKRTVDILALLQLYLFITVAGRLKEEKKYKRVPTAVIVLLCVFAAGYQFEQNMSSYFNKYQLLLICVVITICVVPWLAKTKSWERKLSAVIVCVVTLYTGAMVNPIMKGLDTIYTKPVAQEIMSIVELDKDAKWIALDGVVPSGFTISCGARTINSTNFIPNYDLWEILDEDGEYEECWNRYAHINIRMTEDETSVSLNTQDSLTILLSYKDLKKIEVSYIYALSPLHSTENVELEEIYNEAGNYIYKVNYD